MKDFTDMLLNSSTTIASFFLFYLLNPDLLKNVFLKKHQRTLLSDIIYFFNVILHDFSQTFKFLQFQFSFSSTSKFSSQKHNHQVQMKISNSRFATRYNRKSLSINFSYNYFSSFCSNSFWNHCANYYWKQHQKSIHQNTTFQHSTNFSIDWIFIILNQINLNRLSNASNYFIETIILNRRCNTNARKISNSIVL